MLTKSLQTICSLIYSKRLVVLKKECMHMGEKGGGNGVNFMFWQPLPSTFHSEEGGDGIGSKLWFLSYHWDAKISFDTSALSCSVSNAMIATCRPGWHLPCFCCIVEQFQKMECFSSPSPFHIIFPTPQLVIDSASAIVLEIFVCIKRTTSQTVQSNCINSMYSFQFKMMKEIQRCQSIVKEHLMIFVKRKIIA